MPCVSIYTKSIEHDLESVLTVYDATHTTC